MLAELQNSLVAESLRGSTWVYPLVNAAHILGFALLVGAIVPLDLRRLGLWRSVPVATLSRVLTPIAGAGLVIAVTAGVLLFITRAVEYAASGLFQAKIGLVAIAVMNAIVFRRRGVQRSAAAPNHTSTIAARGTALVSLLCWSAALLLGRLVGYF
ncbi:MAG: hypothetical protein H0V34_11155 [Gammaproteobacteria bacterium]|nr:hypothetical protein [Gammaproteobacteria bacterium]MBA3731097.1 hypothetical protein [Gammaproteobacteria bacterium]